MVFSKCAKVVAEKFLCNNKENFHDNYDQSNNDNKELKTLFIIALWLVVVLCVGMWLWNNIVVKVTTIFRPMKSIWQFLGLVLVMDLLIPTCC